MTQLILCLTLSPFQLLSQARSTKNSPKKSPQKIEKFVVTKDGRLISKEARKRQRLFELAEKRRLKLERIRKIRKAKKLAAQKAKLAAQRLKLAKIKARRLELAKIKAQKRNQKRQRGLKITPVQDRTKKRVVLTRPKRRIIRRRKLVSSGSTKPSTSANRASSRAMPTTPILTNSMAMGLTNDGLAKSYPSVDFELNGKLGSRNYADDFGEAAVFSAKFTSKASVSFHPTFKTFFDGGFRFESGAAVSLFETNQPNSGLALSDIYADWEPVRFLNLKAGIISPSSHHSSLMNATSFPTARETLQYTTPNGVFKPFIFADQAIPTSSNLSTQAEGTESVPTFHSEGIGIDIKIKNRLNLGARISHFSFSELPEDIARQSLLHGNTILVRSETERAFATGFSGFEGLISSNYLFNDHFHLNLRAEFVMNSEAEQGLNLGGLYQAEVLWMTSPSFGLRPRVFYFFNEPDSSPAFYNSALFGHNNMSGVGFRLTAELPKTFLKLTAQYISRNLLNLSDVQSNNREIMFFLEANYGN